MRPVEVKPAVATIHIIEDDGGVRDALSELVRGHGHAVQAYADGEAFIQAGAPPPEDVIFVDLGLPGVDGRQVVRWLQDLPRPPRIVVISGLSLGDIGAFLNASPGLTLLRKPLGAEAVADHL